MTTMRATTPEFDKRLEEIRQDPVRMRKFLKSLYPDLDDDFLDGYIKTHFPRETRQVNELMGAINRSHNLESFWQRRPLLVAAGICFVAALIVVAIEHWPF